MKISVVIHTYNSEHFLPRCLEGVKDFDEIVICDMYSTDSTLEIAEKYKCRILMHENVGFADPARDFAIHQSTNDWVLVVDSDEVVPPNLPAYLYNFVEKEGGTFDGLYISRKNYFMGRFMHGSYPDYQLRLFRSSKTTWPPTVHSRPLVDGKVARIPRRRKDLAFEHLINETVEQRLAKLNVYTNMECVRREGSTYSILGACFSCLNRFNQKYFFKGGFRDGKAGFAHAAIDSIYKFITVAKLWEQRIRK